MTNKEIENFYLKLNHLDKKRIDKIKNKTRKNQSIIGKILLCKLLKTEYNLNYFDLDFYYNENGKPYIKNTNIFFNISHSHDYVICVISNKEIGADIEKIRNININSMKYYCTEKEINYITNNKCDMNKKGFQIYTLKEAYIKMQGSNLNTLKEIEFNIKNKNIQCSDSNTECFLINDISEYVIAIVEKTSTYYNKSFLK